MFCSRCGAPNPDTGSWCSRCGSPLASTGAPSASPYAPAGASPYPPPGAPSAPYTAPNPAQPGWAPGPMQPPMFGAPPDNHMVWAVLATVLCCLPFGIVAIVYASQVNSKFNAGDYMGAQASARSAKTWCWVSLICGLVATVIYLGLMAIGAAAG